MGLVSWAEKQLLQGPVEKLIENELPKVETDLANFLVKHGIAQDVASKFAADLQAIITELGPVLETAITAFITSKI